MVWFMDFPSLVWNRAVTLQFFNRRKRNYKLPSHYSSAKFFEETLKHFVVRSLLLKIPNIAKRCLLIFKVRTIIKSGAVILLHPAFLHS